LIKEPSGGKRRGDQTVSENFLPSNRPIAPYCTCRRNVFAGTPHTIPSI
jgi:hypothetical protein